MCGVRNQFVKTAMFWVLLALTFLANALAGDEDLSKRMEIYLEKNEEHGFSGVVFIAEKEEIIFANGYGYSDRENEISNDIETVFDIGSLTKQFTGAAILKLVEQRKLNTQDTLGDIFPDIPEDKRNITIHQLLTHTAGFPQFSGKDYDFVETQIFQQDVFGMELVSLPGEKFDYSNVGYSILGLVIEKISGREYEAFLQEHIFGPAGMQNTGYLIPDWKLKNIAQGYDYGNNNVWGTNLERWAEDGGVAWHLKANGGIMSTVEDMYRWHVALEAHSVLPPALKAQYEAPHVDAGNGQFYGYGWRNIKTSGDKLILAHNGSNYIFFAAMMRFVDDERVAIFMTNEGRQDVFVMSREIIRMMTRPDYEPALISKPSLSSRLQMKLKRLGL